MSGYTPLFNTMLEGTLHGRWPHTGVWACLLSMVDHRGEIDKHPRLIASAIGISLPDLLECIKDFCAPDPESRSPENEGRRLTPLDTREWGWRVVNVKKYRLKASGKAQIMDGRNAEKVRKYKAKIKQTPMDTDGHRQTPTHTHTHTQTKEREVREPETPSEVKKRPSKRAPPDFVPDASIALEKLPHVDLEAEVAKFRDWEFKTPRSDWPAVWRNWVQTAKERGHYAKKAANGEWGRVT